jgi:Highly conserved protein containing a thioredoxin domain
MNERIRGNAWKINWKYWNKETFELAKKKNKLILLSLSGVWCHWCHVMDETTYSDEEVIKLINENFIPIRVDVDERPDISERYNFGGYPTFVFLTYEGNIITGGTYVPPEQFKEILKEMISLSKSEKIKDLEQQQQIKRTQPPKGELNVKVIWDIADILINSFDNIYGGFGMESKFPLPDAILFLENMYMLTKKEGFKLMFVKTLKGILNGLYDRIEGGFFRYSVTRDWKTPHYEKMLETNSNLLKIYSIAYYLTNENDFKEACDKTYSYLMNKMFDIKENLFYASQDADEEYYSKSLDERLKMKEPYKDPNLYSCYNSICADALIFYGIIFGKEESVKLAKEIAEVIINKRLREKGIVHSLKQEISYLNDNVLFLRLLNNLYQLTFDKYYLDKIDHICKVLTNYYLDEYGLLKDKVTLDEDFGLLKESYHPIQENSLAVRELMLAGFILNNDDYKKISMNIASMLAYSYPRFNVFASSFANSLLFALNPIEVKLVFQDMGEAFSYMKNLKFLLHPSMYTNFQESNESYQKEGVYICKGKTCFSPEINEENIKKLIEKINSQILSP